MIHASLNQGPNAKREAEPSLSAGKTQWEQAYDDPAFRVLLAQKAVFIIPSFIFFVAYYFALPVLVGYAPGLMERKIVGKINLAYLFALSQFAVGWFLMWRYVRRARAFDAMSEAVAANARLGKTGYRAS
jgi:uncharacterized membrane protein (DUF485 family)